MARPAGLDDDRAIVMRAVFEPAVIHEQRLERLDQQIVAAEVDFRIRPQIQPNLEAKVAPFRHAALVIIPAETISGRGTDDIDTAGRIKAGDLFDKLDCRRTQ